MKKLAIILACVSLLAATMPSCQPHHSRPKHKKVKRGKPMPCPIKDC